jgi:MFS family permease
MAIACVVFSMLSAGIYLSPSPLTAFVLLGLSLAGVYSIYGPLFATIQTLVPARIRATSVAVVYLFSNLIGMGLGPLAAGMMSDALRPRFGEESLRYSLLLLSAGYLWSAWHLWRASKTVRRDLGAVREEVTGPVHGGAAAPAGSLR